MLNLASPIDTPEEDSECVRKILLSLSYYFPQIFLRGSIKQFLMFYLRGLLSHKFTFLFYQTIIYQTPTLKNRRIMSNI